MLKKGLTIATICVLISAALVFTGCRSDSHQGKVEFMVDYISETLDLTDPQREQLDGIKEEFMAELRKEQIDRQRIKELISQKRSQMDEIIDLAVVRLAEFHSTLTPEQREKLVAKLEYFRKKHQRRWE